jgi:hypothetical protein
VFLGGSLQIVLLYRGGVIGVVLFLGLLAYLGRASLSKRSMDQIFLMWLFLLLMAGVTSSTFAIPRLQSWRWTMAGILLQSHRVRGLPRGAASVYAWVGLSDAPLVTK